MACSILLSEVRAGPQAASTPHMRTPTELCLCDLDTACVKASWHASRLDLIAVAMGMQNDEFLRLVINSIKNDITCRNEAFQCLALNFVGSGEGFEYAGQALRRAAPLCA